jgi:hypothetical protein
LRFPSLVRPQLLKNAAWGLRFRVLTGSGLSLLDLASDINVIVAYTGEEGLEVFGYLMLGMVLTNVGGQLLIVCVQHGKMGWCKLLQEALIVVSGLKPGEWRQQPPFFAARALTARSWPQVSTP